MQHPRIELLLMAIGGMLAIGILKWGFGGERAFDQAALGNLTIEYLAKDSIGRPIHTIKQKPIEVEGIVHDNESDRQTIFFLGNSQTHSINQKESGDLNYPQILGEKHPELKVRCHSLPNANLQEFLVLIEWWSSKMKIDQLFVPVFMDDLREDGLRKDFIPLIIGEQFEVRTSQKELTEKLNAELRAFQMPEESAVVGGEAGESTPQDRSEKFLNDWLGEKSEVWANRPNARGDFFMKLYQWRNTLFGINASTKRKMIPARYEWNMQALESIMDFAASKSIHLTIYIPPIRTDVEVPYDLAEYAKFKAEVAAMAEKHQVNFADFDGIVPGELWGLKGSTNAGGEPELDYMHFQGRGHEILADALETLLIAAL